MESLPIDILETIFSCLPFISTLRCKLVCKTWGSVIGESKSKVGTLFALRGKNGEVQLYYDDRLDTVKLERYDSGEKLICSVYYKPDPVGGFGYIKSTNEYKVFGIYYNPLDGKTSAHMYTLGSQVGWRVISNEILYKFWSWSSGIFGNGAIHMVHYSDGDTKFVAFDLADERFKFVLSIPSDEAGHPRFALLGGNLCDVFHYSRRIDIWAIRKKVKDKTVFLPVKKLMGQYYDETWSWSREFQIDCDSWYNPFAITDSNKVLLWHNNLEYIQCYDPNTSTLNKSSNAYRETYGSCHQIIPHMNTLISLKDLGEPLGNDGSFAHI